MNFWGKLYLATIMKYLPGAGHYTAKPNTWNIPALFVESKTSMKIRTVGNKYSNR